jgi:DNA helicase-2/ATP-dependent DNA helicase PcrA
VDEYQDTNLLQEQIYFELARVAKGHGGSIAVVGDDDQSLYRFRGATVELFAGFCRRLEGQRGIKARHIPLERNYRSTRTIVDWTMNFIELDTDYAAARVPGKPRLTAAREEPYIDYPVLGMFRPDLPALARDLASFIDAVFNGGGVQVNQPRRSWRVVKDPDDGVIGDCALLCSSPRDYNDSGDPRLPLLIRRELDQLPRPLPVFNPRGMEFSEVEEVARLCGLMLECIDPGKAGKRIQDAINFPRDVAPIFDRWRQEANDWIKANPAAPGAKKGTNTLRDFVRAWQARTPQGKGRWPREVPLIRLLYELVTWMPTLQDDPEGLIYLEVITRTIGQSARFIAYDATVQRDAPHAERSVKALLWGIFEPLASGIIDIDEELIELLPRDRLNILSVHQAKGLEFPLVIVDVGSDFRTDHWTQAFRRFPRSGGRPHNLEDTLRPFSTDKELRRATRSPRDRAFDDLIRQYFVAYSRPQDVLMLVGLGSPADGPLAIPNVATRWVRGDSQNGKGLPGVVLL